MSSLIRRLYMRYSYRPLLFRGERPKFCKECGAEMELRTDYAFPEFSQVTGELSSVRLKRQWSCSNVHHWHEEYEHITPEITDERRLKKLGYIK